MRKHFRTFRPSALSSKLNLAFQWLQLFCVRWVQKREARWSLRQKHIYLAIFLLVSCATCVSVFLSGLYHKPDLANKVIQVAPIRAPIIQQSVSSRINLNSDDTIRVLTFLHLVDSLQLSLDGKRQLQKYFEERPGMRDSIPILKKIFKK